MCLSDAHLQSVCCMLVGHAPPFRTVVAASYSMRGAVMEGWRQGGGRGCDAESGNRSCIHPQSTSSAPRAPAAVTRSSMLDNRIHCQADHPARKDSADNFREGRRPRRSSRANASASRSYRIVYPMVKVLKRHQTQAPDAPTTGRRLLCALQCDPRAYSGSLGTGEVGNPGKGKQSAAAAATACSRASRSGSGRDSADEAGTLCRPLWDYAVDGPWFVVAQV